MVGVAGALHDTVDGVTHEVTPGVRVFSPRGKPHGFENRGTVDARVLLTFSPAAVFGPAYSSANAAGVSNDRATPRSAAQPSRR